MFNPTPAAVTHTIYGSTITERAALTDYPVRGDALRLAAKRGNIRGRAVQGQLWQREHERELKAGLAVIGNWLCQSVGECTCGPTDWGQHEPACGYEPVRRIVRATPVTGGRWANRLAPRAAL